MGRKSQRSGQQQEKKTNHEFKHNPSPVNEQWHRHRCPHFRYSTPAQLVLELRKKAGRLKEEYPQLGRFFFTALTARNRQLCGSGTKSNLNSTRRLCTLSGRR
jgi:hypothetical protein